MKTLTTLFQWPALVLIFLVFGILWAQRRPSCAMLFGWLPVPLWCYALPMLLIAVGWLPANHAVYAQINVLLLPLALACLLLGADLPAIARSGKTALIAAALGAVGILLGTSCGVWLLKGYLPPESWKGAAALSATWTGGTMNLMAMQSILQIPDAVFAPLIVVDAVIAYSWMALLVFISSRQDAVNQWLGATTAAQRANVKTARYSPPRTAVIFCLLTALGIVLTANTISPLLPSTTLISSASGWRVLLVTTLALVASLLPKVRAWAVAGVQPGYWGLYLVLAATGAQASLKAFLSVPAWILLGIFVAAIHGALLLTAGKLWRIPIGTLATASQANIGGVVSAPLVGAVYHPSLVPIGLLLAVAGNALGTYFGLLAASLARWLLQV